MIQQFPNFSLHPIFRTHQTNKQKNPNRTKKEKKRKKFSLKVPMNWKMSEIYHLSAVNPNPMKDFCFYKHEVRQSDNLIVKEIQPPKNPIFPTPPKKKLNFFLGYYHIHITIKIERHCDPLNSNLFAFNFFHTFVRKL